MKLFSNYGNGLAAKDRKRTTSTQSSKKRNISGRNSSPITKKWQPRLGKIRRRRNLSGKELGKYQLSRPSTSLWSMPIILTNSLCTCYGIKKY